MSSSTIYFTMKCELLTRTYILHISKTPNAVRCTQCARGKLLLPDTCHRLSSLSICWWSSVYRQIDTYTHTHTCTKLSWLSQFLSHWIYRFGTIICIAWIRWGDTTINANCSVSSRASYVWRFAVSQILLELNSIYIRYSDDWSNHISFVQPSG